MQTTALYLILFFKGVISKIVRCYQAMFPLFNCRLCKVMGDVHFRHVMLYLYATKSEYVRYNLQYIEAVSPTNNFLIKYTTVNNEERLITGNNLFQSIMRSL